MGGPEAQNGGCDGDFEGREGGMPLGLRPRGSPLHRGVTVGVRDALSSGAGAVWGL
jgi:hypothetical protein